jgi:hypothetical protein
MYLQGNLQAVFDALYEMGVIEPVLKMDWQKALGEVNHDPKPLFEVVQIANTFQNDVGVLITKLENFDDKSLGYLAMEVAREYADFHLRNQIH